MNNEVMQYLINDFEYWKEALHHTNSKEESDEINKNIEIIQGEIRDLIASR